jgi:hypothetical protein
MSGPWMQHLALVLLMALGLPALVRAEQSDSVDFDAEAKQAAQEDEAQNKEREQGIKGKYQRKFLGVFNPLSAAPDTQNMSSEVVGTFITNSSDLKPGRTYLVKLEGKSKDLLASLISSKGTSVEVMGKLRNIGPDGEAKYLIASSCQTTGATPAVTNRRKRGGF